MKNLLLGIATFLSATAAWVLYLMNFDSLVVKGLWAAAAALGLAWIFVSRKNLLQFFTRKSTRTGVNVAFVVFLVLGILVFVNMLAKEYNWRKDLTRSSVNSLSPQTIKILKELPQEVKVYYFSTLQDKEKNATLFKNYAYVSKRFLYEFVDTTRRPTLVQSMEVKRNNTVVFQLGGTNKKVKVEGVSEEKLTNGLIKLLQTKEQVVYFVTGHGERTLSSDPLGYSALQEELEKQGYTVKEFNLLSAANIPADAAMLAIIGPTTTFFPKELEAIKAWLAKGGRLLAALDLDPRENGLAKGSRQLAEFLRNYGVKTTGQMLVDHLSRLANEDAQVVLGFSGSPEHPVTKDFPFSARSASFLFSLSTYFTQETSDFAVTPLVLTSPEVWAESDWASLKAGKVSFQQGQDTKGQMALAVAMEKEKSRLVVFGTSAFATNLMLDKALNRNLFLNAVAWLADNEQLISILPKDEGGSIKPFHGGMVNLVLFVSVFLTPLLLVVAGVWVWVRRKKL